MKPIVIGGIVAAAVIIAFIVGMSLEDKADGPIEKLGESIDKAAD